MRLCTHRSCRAELPALRRDSYCAECRADASRRWRERNPEKAKASWTKGNHRCSAAVPKTPEALAKYRAQNRKRTIKARERRRAMTQEERLAFNAKMAPRRAIHRKPIGTLPPEKQAHIRELKNASHRRVYAADPEKARLREKRYREADPERYRAYGRKYWNARKAEDPGFFLKWTKKRYSDLGRRHFAAWMKEWRKRNADKVSTWDAVKRAQRAGAPGHHSHQEWLTCLSRHDNRCAYCGCVLTPATRTRDHVIPISRGGSSDISNIVPACRSCNSMKNKKTREEFLATTSGRSRGRSRANSEHS